MDYHVKKKFFLHIETNKKVKQSVRSSFRYPNSLTFLVVFVLCFLDINPLGYQASFIINVFLTNSQFKINAKGYFGSFFFKPDIFELMTYSTKGRKKSSEKEINTYNFDDILSCSSEGHREVEILE